MYINNSHYGTRNGRILSTLFFIVLFVLVCGSYTTYNSPIYEANYYDGGDPSDEWLFLSFEKLGYSLSLDYKYFIFILYGIGLLLFRKTTTRLVGGYAWIVYLLFCIYPLGEVRSAVRNTLAMFLIIYAFPLLTSKRFVDILKFIILLILASGFHRVSIFYFLLLLIPFYQSTKSFRLRRWVSIMTYAAIALAILICFSSSAINSLQPVLIRFTSESDLAREGQSVYFENIAGYGFILFGLYQLAWIVILGYFKSRQEHTETQSTISTFLDLVYYSDIALLVMIIAYKFDSNFFRIFMNLVPLNYISLVLVGRRLNKTGWKMTPLIWGALLFIIVFGIRQTAVFFDDNLITMFTNNWLIHWHI